MSWMTGIILAILSRVIPSIVGGWNWNLYSRGEKALVILFVYDIAGIIVGAVLAYIYKNNIIMTNLYSILEIILLSIFFKEFLTSQKAKQGLSVFVVLYVIIFLLGTFFVFGLHQNNPVGDAISVFYIISFSALILGEIAGDDINLIRQGRFWIVLGLLTFYLLNGGQIALNYWLTDTTNSSLYFGLHYVLSYSFYIVNLFYALGLWLIAKERKADIMSKETAN